MAYKTSFDMEATVYLPRACPDFDNPMLVPAAEKMIENHNTTNNNNYNKSNSN